MIQIEYVQFETAKLLKQAGFPQDYHAKASDHDGWMFAHGDECDGEFFTTPTQAQAMRWFREEKIISVEISTDENIGDWQVDAYDWRFNTPKPIKRLESYGYPTYEAAAEAGIQAACRYLIERGGVE